MFSLLIFVILFHVKSFITKPIHCIPFMQPGRLVNVIVNNDEFGWGAVINFQKKPSLKVSIITLACLDNATGKSEYMSVRRE